MDDQRSVASAPIATPPVSRTVITIPKAVASMTSIPTREDYKAVVDANMEKKRRKERGSFLDPPEDDPNSERRRSSVVSGAVDRRRGRQTRPSTASIANSGPPKLKIKIGNSIIGPDPTNLQDDSRIRPPKKRLSNIPSKPSMEDLKRESMKYRRLVMADFNNEEEPKVKSKKDKNGKRKKRQNKKEGRVQLVEDGGVAPPKLIIRLGKSKSANDEDDTTKTGDDGGASCSDNTRVEPPPLEPTKEETIYPPDVQVCNEKQPADPSARPASIGNVRSAKVTPIRLKLTRCQEGYELKAPAASSASKDSTTEKLTPSTEHPGTSEISRTHESETTSKIQESMEKSSKEDDVPILTENVTHNTSGCPPATLPQGCQVR